MSNDLKSDRQMKSLHSATLGDATTNIICNSTTKESGSLCIQAELTSVDNFALGFSHHFLNVRDLPF